MGYANIDPLRIDPNRLDENELRYQFGRLREQLVSKDGEIRRLNSKPRWKFLLKGFIAVCLGLLTLLSALIYTYAINKLTGTSPDKGANSLLNLAIGIYIISLIVQVCVGGLFL